MNARYYLILLGWALMIVAFGLSITNFIFVANSTVTVNENLLNKTLCDDNNQCTWDRYDEATKTCSFQPIPNGYRKECNSSCMRSGLCVRDECTGGQCLGYCNSSDDCPSLTLHTGLITSEDCTTINTLCFDNICHYQIYDLADCEIFAPMISESGPFTDPDFNREYCLGFLIEGDALNDCLEVKYQRSEAEFGCIFQFKCSFPGQF